VVGSYQVYTVTGDDETIESVALGPHSLWRGSGGIEAHRQANARIMYDQSSKLFKGMKIVLPIVPCYLEKAITDGQFDCYQAGTHCTNGTLVVETLENVASKFRTTAAVLLRDSLNAESIGGAGAGAALLSEGMMLRVPKLNFQSPGLTTTGVCKAIEGWSCYTVVAGDSVEGIALNHGLHPGKVCNEEGLGWNSLSNCSVIEIGQQLALPSGGQEECKPLPGVYECFSSPPCSSFDPASYCSPKQYDEIFLHLEPDDRLEQLCIK
jgi:hypothetical protein